MLGVTMSCRTGDCSEASFTSLSVTLLPHEGLRSPGDLGNV